MARVVFDQHSYSDTFALVGGRVWDSTSLVLRDGLAVHICAGRSPPSARQSRSRRKLSVSTSADSACCPA